MYESVEKSKESKNESTDNLIRQKSNNGLQSFEFADNRPETIAQRKLKEITTSSPRVQNSTRTMADSPQPIQRIMKQAGMDKDSYRKLTMSTVILYAELDNKPVGPDNGIFKTGGGKHAEANLKAYLESSDLTKGNLTICLSTSPCSSSFGTRDDGHEGCQEKLESLHASGFKVTVHSDHPYQPHAVAAMEREQGFPGGFSSVSSAHASTFPSTFSHAPKALVHDDLVDKVTSGSVAQLKTGHKSTRIT